MKLLKMLRMKSKKGDVTDMLIFIVLTFVLMIGLFILAFIIPQISGGLADAGLNETSEGAGAIDELSTFGTVTIQRGALLLFVGLIMSTMITSFFARTHPIFLFLYIFVLGVTVFIGIYLGNAYQDFSEIEIFSDTLASQGMISIVMNNILTITAVVGVLSMIIVFSKFSAGGRQRI